MVIFRSKDTFLLVPAVGFVRDGGIMRLTVAFLCYGISFRLFESYPNGEI